MLYQRHGDVLFENADGIPETAKKLDKAECRCKEFKVCAKHLVLAHGEVSGHAHRFNYKTDDIEIYEGLDGTVYLKNLSDKPASVAQTNGTTSNLDLDYLSKNYKKDGLHAPIKDVLAPNQIKRIDFPQEFNWIDNEVARARD